MTKKMNFQKKTSQKFSVFALFLFFSMNAIYSNNNVRGNGVEAENITLQQKNIEIKGNVTDENGVPIPGASVIAKKLKGKGVATDIDGNYSISVPENAVLVFSYIGYQTREVSVKGKKIINVSLKEDTKELGEVVVTAYGTTQKKASVVGSVQSVKPADLKIPSTNLSASFAGRMAGVIAFQRSGQPGADGATFYIRGISTISGVSAPLILVDGVQVSAGDLNNLDPEVIEGFSILKDATATALYGSRGANGVMIVTTKSGQNLEKPKMNIRVETNVSTPTSIPKFVSGARYMRLYNEAIDNLGSSLIPYSEDQILGTEENRNPYIYPNIDWYKELFTTTSYARKFNFNIRGGGKKIDYFMNISMNQETGMLRGLSQRYFSFDNNINVKKYNFINNLNARLSETSKVTLRINTQLRDERTPNVNTNNLFGYVVNTNPVDFPISYPSDGVTLHEKWGAYLGNNTAPYNPIAALASGYNDNFASTVIANLEFEQKLDFILEGLKFNGLMSFKNWSSTTNARRAPYNTYSLESFSQNPDGSYTITPKLNGTEVVPVLTTTSGTTGDRTMYYQAILNYDRTFVGKHALNMMVVYNQNEFNLNNTNHNEAYNRMINSLPRRKQGISGRKIKSFYTNKEIKSDIFFNIKKNISNLQHFFQT